MASSIQKKTKPRVFFRQFTESIKEHRIPINFTSRIKKIEYVGDKYRYSVIKLYSPPTDVSFSFEQDEYQPKKYDLKNLNLPVSGSLHLLGSIVSTPVRALSATIVNEINVELTWVAPVNAGSSPILRYDIYRSTVIPYTIPGTSIVVDTAPPVLIGSVNGSTLTYTDEGLALDKTYYYRVYAISQVGMSPRSNTKQIVNGVVGDAESALYNADSETDSYSIQITLEEEM
jgi:hypothetical protein